MAQQSKLPSSLSKRESIKPGKERMRGTGDGSDDDFGELIKVDVVVNVDVLLEVGIRMGGVDVILNIVLDLLDLMPVAGKSGKRKKNKKKTKE